MKKILLILLSFSLFGVVALGAASFFYWNQSENDFSLVGELPRNPAQTISFVPGTEIIPENEPAQLQKVSDKIKEDLEKTYKKLGAPYRRDVHVKTHGCVSAQFKVNNSGLPPELRLGVFKTNQTFPAWIRFSNGGGGKGSSDNSLQPRGFALKLMNVPGEKILETEKSELTQDFLLINGPVFFVENVKNYEKLFLGNKLAFLLTHPHDARRIISLVTKKVSNPLFVRYWSETPYALGPTAVKYSSIPCSKDNWIKTDRDNPNFLRKAMALNLAAGDACFNFLVQLRTDEEEMPIEDPTINWEEEKSPFIPVAQITIKKQNFDSNEQNKFCENLSFTPWHSLPEHRPLGGINRSRKMVYNTISAFRHEMNGIKRVEPKP